MESSKPNQKDLAYSCSAGEASVNLYTGRMLFEHHDLSIGANSFNISFSHIYNSQPELPSSINTHMGDGWKLSIQQYLIKNSETEYIYYDSHGYKNKFKRYRFDEIILPFPNHTYVPDTNLYDRKSSFYDSSGSGLRLTIHDKFYYDYIEDKYKYIYNAEICDDLGNKMKFSKKGLLTNSISSLNPKIIKNYDYLNDKLIKVYDNRKNTRAINFYYEDDLLSVIKVFYGSIEKQVLEFSYENKNLIKISKKEYSGSAKKDITMYQYNNKGLLEYTVASENYSSLKMVYDNLNRVSNITTGIMKLNPIYEKGNQTQIYCGDNLYLGDDEFLISSNNKIIGHNFSIPSENIENYSEFEYSPSVPLNYTRVINEKGIKFIYYFNSKGFTTGVFEDLGNDQYRTLYKTSGWELSDNDIGGSISINGKNSISLDNNSIYTVPINKLENFRKIFGSDNLLVPKKHAYVDNFVVSFWVLFNDKENNVKANISYNYERLNDVRTVYTNNYYSFIDNVPSMSWQYVSIPITFDEYTNSSVILNRLEISELKQLFFNFKLSFDGVVGNIQIADLRIAVGNTNRTIVADQPFNRVDEIEYIGLMDTVENETLGHNFFMTDSDILKTYNNLYKKSNLDQFFDLVSCNDTKVIPVKELSIIKKGIKYKFEINSEGVPNYYIKIKNRVNKDTWCMTESQVRFFNKYYEQKTMIEYKGQKDTVNNARITEENSTKTYKWVNYNGTSRAKKDAYNVISENFYDGFGNLESIELFNENINNEYKIKKVFEYKDSLGNSIKEEDREVPSHIIENGITKKIYYKEPFMDVDTTEIDNSKIKTDYDNYHERIDKISSITPNNFEVFNKFSYDEHGKLKNVNDQNGRSYGFEYNKFGEVTKYLEGNNTLLEKEVIRNETISIPNKGVYTNADKVLEKSYRNLNADISETYIDKYGRPQATTNKNIYKVNDITTFRYQDQGNPYIIGDSRYDEFSFSESALVAKVTQINDPYENTTYNYHYDGENNLVGYSNSKGFEVKQLTDDDIEIKIANDERSTKIIHEDTEVQSWTDKVYIEPRIRRTIDKEKDVSEYQNLFDLNYSHDSLGRQSTKSHLYYNAALVDGFVDYFHEFNLINSYKDYTNLLEKYEYKLNTKKLDIYTRATHNYTGKFTYKYDYDNKGNIKTQQEKSIGDNIITRADQTIDFEPLYNKDIVTTYTYNSLNQLTVEDNGDLGKYEYEYTDKGQLKAVSLDGTYIKNFIYNGNGKKTKYNDLPIIYDNIGNVLTNHSGKGITYNSRNMIERQNISSNYDVRNLYNHSGVRYKKIIIDNNSTFEKTYYNEGSKILQENWSDNTKLRYYYDINGIAGIQTFMNGETKTYCYVKDLQGNVRKVLDSNYQVVAEYFYDAWGNCSVKDIYGNVISNPKHIGNINPFRWKSYYFDVETGVYAIYQDEKTRFYDPVLMMFLDAETPENIFNNMKFINGLDKNSILVDNIININDNSDDVFTSVDLYPDPLYDPNEGKSFWQIHINKIKRWIYLGTAFIASLIIGNGMFMFCLYAAISGFLIGGLIGGLTSLNNGNYFIEGFAEAAVYGAITGFYTAALMFCASRVIRSLFEIPIKPIKSKGEGQAVKYGPMNKGPLPDNVANTFRSGTYTEIVTQKQTTLYRVYGGNSSQIGGYWTTTKPQGPVQSIIDSALDPIWGNNATKVVSIVVPKGTTIYQGFAAPQGGLVGGGIQVYIERVNPLWIIN